MIPIVEDKDGNIIHIDDVDKDNNDKEYICLACGTSVKPRSLNIDNKMQPHFYHLNASECRNESIYHKMYKKYLFKEGKDFILVWDEVKNKYSVREIFIEKEYETKFGIYKPDVTVITDCDKTIFFEMNYSSKKYEDEYFDKWSELNNDVVEIDVKKLYRLSYTENTPEFDIVYHDGVCNHKYEKHSRMSTYYKTIGNYKRENKFTPEKIQQIEKLDWFWAELKNYKKGLTDGDKIVELFSYLDIIERDICVEIVKKLKCIDLVESFRTIVIESLTKYTNIKLKQYIDRYKCKFRIVKVTPQKYRIVVSHNDCKYQFTEDRFYKNYCKYNCGSCNDYCDCFIIKSTDGFFYKDAYEYVDILSNYNDYINRYIKSFTTYLNNEYLYTDVNMMYENDCIYDFTKEIYRNIPDHIKKSDCSFLNDNVDNFESICLYYYNMITVDNIIEFFDRYDNRIKTLLPDIYNSICNDIYDYRKLKVTEYFYGNFKLDELKIYLKHIKSYDSYNLSINRCISDIQRYSVDEVNNLYYQKVFDNYLSKLHIIIKYLNNKSEYINYSVDNHDKNGLVITFKHKDIDLLYSHRYTLKNISIIEKSIKDIIDCIIIFVNDTYRCEINRMFPEGYEIWHMKRNNQEEV